MNNWFNKTNKKKLAHSLLRWTGWLMVAAVIVLSLIKLPKTSVSIPSGDKLLHLSSYFFLSYWFFHTYYKHKFAVVLGFVLLGFLLEILQSLTPHRFLEWQDILMNVIGVLMAYFIFWKLKLRAKRVLLS